MEWLPYPKHKPKNPKPEDIYLITNYLCDDATVGDRWYTIIEFVNGFFYARETGERLYPTHFCVIEAPKEG